VGPGRSIRHQGPCRDVGHAPAVTISPVRPSQPLQCHPRRCGNTRRQDIATPTVVPPTASRQWHPRTSTRADTERATPTPPPSKPLLDGYRARHDVPPEARFARTAIYSTALCAILPHVARTVRHACKLPPPWPIKGGAVHRPQGGRQGARTRTLPAFTTILALASISTSGTCRPGLLSRLACSPLSASTTVQGNIMPRAHPCWTYDPGQNQDKTQCH
jgi:hypothetical protein